MLLHHFIPTVVVAVAPPKPDRVPEHVRGKLREEARDEILAPAVDAHVRPRQPQEKICLWRRSAPRAQLAEQNYPLSCGEECALTRGRRRSGVRRGARADTRFEAEPGYGGKHEMYQWLPLPTRVVGAAARL